MVAVPSARPAASSGMHGSTITVKPAKQTNGAVPRTVIPLSARRAERLDLNTVERRGRPFSVEEPAPRTHTNGIPEAPTFRPTEEQWKNPFAYLKSIEAEGKKYGVIKIIPPDSWNPDFVIDTEVRSDLVNNVHSLLTNFEAISFQNTQARAQLGGRRYALSMNLWVLRVLTNSQGLGRI